MTELSDQIKALGALGYSYSQIRDITGASKGTISHWLGKGQKEKTTQRTNDLRKTIRDWIIADKESRPCADCGNMFRYYVTQYDHLPKYRKSFAIAKFKNHTASLDKVKAEVAKCELVCANCHAERTHLRRIEAKQHKEDVNTLLDSSSEDDNHWEDEYV